MKGQLSIVRSLPPGTKVFITAEREFGSVGRQPRQVLYVPVQGTEVVYRFRPDVAKATRDEQCERMMERIFTVTVSYREGRKTILNSQSKGFSVKLNSERVVRRVPAHLGNILGLTPKSMR